MPEYESAEFEHIVEEISKKENPREALDNMFRSDADKSQAIKSVLKKMRSELEALGEADSTNYGHEEMDLRP